MATVTLRIHFHTRWGEDLLCEQPPANIGGAAPPARLRPMTWAGDGFWTLTLETGAAETEIVYRYIFRDRRGVTTREPVWRRLAVSGGSLAVRDHWLSPEWPESAFLRQAFAGVIFQPEIHGSAGRIASAAPDSANITGRRLRLTLRAPRVPRGHRICLIGDHPRLGQWQPDRARPMSGAQYPLWTADLPLAEFGGPVEFKFGLWRDDAARLVRFESGPNRRLPAPPGGADTVVVNCEAFQHATPWKGAGVAVPVFALRSARGYGIGEFVDLAAFADWAAGCGLQMVQLLPVNDTTSDFTWKDSYPYKAISTAALHPIYLDVESLFAEYGQPRPADYAARRAALNRLPQLDYEAVLRDKLAYLRQLFGRVAGAALAQPVFQDYLREHARWLRPYAAFCRLRDRHGTADFTQWGEFARYPAPRVAAWYEPGAPEYDEVMFHCWVQFHLDRQLGAALAAGHARGVAFKGDLPIGIDRSSVEAWTEPELFRLDRQTGAPPAAFAVLGQNWGFPTYNWPRMEADGYAWWRRRLRRMSAAFDALRLDHILGFFRIWEIPQRYTAGIMGHYHPTLPLSREEIRAAGFTRDPAAFTEGAVADAALAEFFGAAAERVKAGVLARGEDGFWRLRPEFAIAAARPAGYAEAGPADQATPLEDGLRRLGFEVLFLEDPDQPGRFHPRINLVDTALFHALPAAEQTALRSLHDDFYHRRHTQFWADEALKKLPPLMDASPMLICGEDLGMVPDCVPVVLKRLGLLSLEVQRWPKQANRVFGDPAAYPYLSVCTTSTHDMPTLRGWWEEEPETRQRFWKEVMRRAGPAPADCAPDICRFIVEQNLAGASMWCILPLQDWLGLDAALRHPAAAAERINVPAIPRHYWRYRMHLTIEQLAAAADFNRQVADLVTAAGRQPES